MASATITAPPVAEFNTAGCLFVLLAVASNFLWGGVSKALGLMLPTLRDQLDTDTWVLGTIISITVATMDVTGLFVGVLEGRLGSRALLISGAVLQSLGLLLVPLCTTALQVSALLISFVGTGIGILNVLNKVYVGRHFTKGYTLAAGIGQSGNAVVFLVVAPVLQLFLDTYGWRGAMLLFAAICCHSVAAAAVVRVGNSPRQQYAAVPVQGVDSPAEKGPVLADLKAFCVRLYEDLDLGIIFEFNFFVLVSCYFGRISTNTAWVIYYVPHLEVKGIPAQTAAVLCSVAGVGFVVGTVLWAPFIDRGWMRTATVLITNNLIFSLALVVDPWVDDVAGQAVITLVSGMGLSALCTVSETLTKDLYPDRLTAAFGTIRFFCFLPRLCVGFLSGWLFDTSGSFDVAFIVAGLIPTVTLIPLVIGRLLQRF